MIKQTYAEVNIMPLKTPEQYEDNLRKMKFKVYLMGEEVKNIVDHPIIRPAMNSVKSRCLTRSHRIRSMRS